MKKYVFIGDSLTFGYGVPKSSSWVSLFKSSSSYDVINKGINGDTCPSILDRFHTDVISLKPTNAFIMAGTNDLLCHRTVKSIIENIDLMIKDCLNNNIIVTIAAPPSIIIDMAKKLFMPSPFYNYCSSELPILRDELKYLCENYSIKFIDFYSAIPNSNQDLFLDGIHLNSEGQTLMYKTFLSS